MRTDGEDADHMRTRIDGRKLRRKMATGPNNTWLTKRRDGKSECWMVAWYDPTMRTVRYRSTRTKRLADAKGVLAHFQLPENAVALAPIERRMSTQVYFIGGEVGPIKIGIAFQPHRRLAALQACSPVRLSILAMGFGGAKVERFYHERFAAHRLHGEWFSRSPEILAEIDRLNGAA